MTYTREQLIDALCERVELQILQRGQEQTGRVILYVDSRTTLIRDFQPGSEGDTIPKLLGMLKLLNEDEKQHIVKRMGAVKS